MTRVVSDRGWWERRLLSLVLSDPYTPESWVRDVGRGRALPLVLYESGVRVAPYAGWKEVSVAECGRCRWERAA